VRLVRSRSVEDPDLAGIYGVFDLDLEHCPNCGGELKIIAAILEQPVIQKIPRSCRRVARAACSWPRCRRCGLARCIRDCGSCRHPGRLQLTEAEPAIRFGFSSRPPLLSRS
jgi:hypothetical protein